MNVIAFCQWLHLVRVVIITMWRPLTIVYRDRQLTGRVRSILLQIEQSKAEILEAEV